MIEKLRALSLRQKIGQLFFIGISGPEIDGHTRGLIDEISPGGVCLFARNIREAAQTRELLDGIRTISVAEPFLSLDQEGGTVDRLRRIVTPLAAANRIRTSAEAATMARLVGETIRSLGFNMDFAPVVDVVSEERTVSSNGLYSRPFGRSKEDVVELAGSFLEGLQRCGPIGCLKHFPGLGAARVDSHEDLPSVDIDGSELFETDLYPYRMLLPSGNVHAIMAAHASFPRIDLQERGQDGKLLPSSLSFNFLTTLLRGELGFDGLIITDDLEMGAIVKNYGIGEACKMAILAGADMLAICANPSAIREGFLSMYTAVQTGAISENRLDESLVRIARLKNDVSDRWPFDIGRINELSLEIAAFNNDLAE